MIRNIRAYISLHTAEYPLLRTIILFVFSGGSAAMVQLATYVVLSRLIGLHYLTASVSAFLIALVVSFLLQKYLTFDDRNHRAAPRQFIWFGLLALCNLLANVGGMYLLVEKVGVYDIFAQILCMGTIAIWSFIIYRTLIFSKDDF